MNKINRHKIVLLNILRFIYSDKMLKTQLGFKGGTMAMLFYNLPRMSVDLDFDLLLDGTVSEDVVFEYLKTKLSAFGKVKQSYKKRYTLFYLLNYQSGYWNIKVEISRRETLSEYEQQDYLGTTMLVMKKEDMVANKCVAMVSRQKITGRDFFDTWFFLKQGWQPNQKIIKDLTNKEPQEFFQQAIELTQKQPKTFFLSSLGELVDEETKKFIKTKLKEELVFQLRMYQSLL